MKKYRRNKGIKIETVMLVMLNAFTIGILVEKIVLSGISWISTIGYFG